MEKPTEADLFFMKRALELAEKAALIDEVPVGAVLVREGQILSEGMNLRECARMATRHAEISAIEEGCRLLGGWRLPGCTLYVTLEPCLMCAGALINARVNRVVFGAYDPKGGAMGSLLSAESLPLNHRISVLGGVMQEECARVLQEYFQRKREDEKESPKRFTPFVL